MSACQVVLLYVENYTHFSLYSYSHFLYNNVFHGQTKGKIPQAIFEDEKKSKKDGYIP